jgi:hypothetical protein
MGQFGSKFSEPPLLLLVKHFVPAPIAKRNRGHRRRRQRATTGQSAVMVDSSLLDDPV